MLRKEISSFYFKNNKTSPALTIVCLAHSSAFISEWLEKLEESYNVAKLDAADREILNFY